MQSNNYVDFYRLICAALLCQELLFVFLYYQDHIYEAVKSSCSIMQKWFYRPVRQHTNSNSLILKTTRNKYQWAGIDIWL